MLQIIQQQDLLGRTVITHYQSSTSKISTNQGCRVDQTSGLPDYNFKARFVHGFLV